MLVLLSLLSFTNTNPDLQRQTHHQQRLLLTAVSVHLLPMKGKENFGTLDHLYRQK